MPNLSLVVNASTAEMRAELALADRDVKSLGRSLRQLSADAEGVTDPMRQVSAQLEAARAEAARLRTEIGESMNSSFERMNKAIKEPLEGLAMLGSSLRETAELAGAMFIVDKVREFGRSMLEAGENAVNMGQATGMSAHQFSLLSQALQLGGGKAEDVARTISHLGTSLQEALTVKSSQAAKAAASLGISHEQLKRAATDTGYALDLLADRFASLDNDLLRAADMQALFGRGWRDQVPLLKRGSAGVEELKQKVEALGVVLSDKESEALEETNEEIRTLSKNIEGAGVRSFVSMIGKIDDMVWALDHLVTGVRAAVGWLDNLWTSANRFLSLHSPFGATGLWGLATGAGQVPALPKGEAGGSDLSYDLDVSAPKPKGRPQPWPTEGGHKAKAAKDDLDQWTREVEAAYRKAVEAETQAADEQQSRDRSLESVFESNMKKMVAAKQITLKQAAGFELQYTAQLMGEEKKRLETIMADDRATADDKQRAYDRLLQLDADYARKSVETLKDAADKVNKSWQEALKPIEDQFATFATDIITRTKSIAKAFDQMMRSIIDDFLKANIKNLFENLIPGMGGAGSGGGGSGGTGAGLGIFGSLLGTGIKDALGAGFGGLFKSGLGAAGGGLLDMLGLGGGAAAGSAADALAGGAQAAGFLIPGTNTALASGFGGLLGKLASMLPAAAGGWDIPQFAGGGIVSMLHSGEMVLPRDIADPLRGAIAGGGFGGGGGHTININAVDAAGVARLFRTHGHELLAGLNGALRNGGALRGGGG